MAQGGHDKRARTACDARIGLKLLRVHPHMGRKIDLIADQQREPLARFILVVQLQPRLRIIQR